MERSSPTQKHFKASDRMGRALVDSYRDKYENLRMKREDGILEVAFIQKAAPRVQRIRA